MAHPGLSSVGQPICAWSESDHKFSICVPSDVIGRLSAESWIAFKRVPRRGLEIGGILLGRTDTRDDITTFWIDGFQQVESEHRSGPSYVLSESDFSRLQDVIKTHKSVCLGIYRSQTRAERLELQESDSKLFGRCFETGPALFLMLGPIPGIAAFFAQADGSLKCIHQFALPSSRMSIMAGASATVSRTEPPRALALQEANSLDKPTEPVGESTHSKSPEQPQVLAVPEARSLHKSTEPVVKSAKPISLGVGSPKPVAPKLVWPTSAALSRAVTGKASWILAAMAAMFILAAAASLTWKAPRPLLAALDRKPPEFLHLTVERAGSSLRLLWDQNSSTVHAATRAVLHIDDGNVHADWDLGPSQLSAGNMTYEPKSQDVTFRMDVYSTQPNASGVVQVVNLPSPAALPRIVPSAPERKPSAPRAIAVPTPAHTSIERAPIVQVSNQRTTVMSPVLPTATIPASPPPPAAPDSREPTESAVIDRPSTSSRRSPIAEAPVLRPAPAAQRDPSITMMADPVSESRLTRVIGKVPLLRRLRKHEGTIPPVPSYQAQPTLRPLDRQSLLHPASVAVRVYVAESGAVKRAEVLEYGDPPNWSLANASLAAARKWTFQPARLDDMAVSSEVILHFRFTP